MLVYVHGLNVPNMVAVTELNTPKGKLSVSLRLNAKGEVVELNNISSVHGKDASTEIDRLSEMGEDLKGALRYVNKEKVSNWLMSSPYMEAGTPNQQKLLSVAKIINDFENPVIKGENVSEPEVGARPAQGTATTTGEDRLRTHERTSLQAGEETGARPAQGTATTTDDGLVRTLERASLQAGEDSLRTGARPAQGTATTTDVDLRVEYGWDVR